MFHCNSEFLYWSTGVFSKDLIVSLISSSFSKCKVLHKKLNVNLNIHLQVFTEVTAAVPVFVRGGDTTNT